MAERTDETLTALAADRFYVVREGLGVQPGGYTLASAIARLFNLLN